MTLVTTGIAAISVSTFIVGLLLLMPRSSVMASVRYVMVMWRTSNDEPGSSSHGPNHCSRPARSARCRSRHVDTRAHSPA